MTTPPDGGAAFPLFIPPFSETNSGGIGMPGMSLRDWFAGQSMQLITATRYIIAGPNGSQTTTSAYHSATPEAVAKSAYDIADAMLAEREKRKPDPDGWIPHAGGPMPCDRETLVDVKFRDETEWLLDRAGDWEWFHDQNRDTDIIAWRPAKKEGGI